MSDPKPIIWNGESLTVAQWARHPLCRVPLPTLRARLTRGWDIGRALDTAPAAKHRKGGRRKAGGVRPVPPLKRRAEDGRAYVRWKAGGRTHERSFGAWGDSAANAAYGRFAAEWATAGRAGGAAGGLSVAALCAAHLDWARVEYRKGGRLTSAYGLVSRAVKFVNDLYGAEPAAEFTPAALRAVRASMIAQYDLARATVQHYAGCLVRVFRWGAGRSLVPAAVADALRHVEPLKPGRTAAREPKPRREVDGERVTATLPHLAPTPNRCAMLGAMVRLQQLTGMRPGEVCGLRPCDLDTRGDVWLYTVGAAVNKTAHRGKARRVWIGPTARAVLAPYLVGVAADAKVYPVARYYYSWCVKRACDRAGVEPWTPHQLRHAHATHIARETGSAQAAADAIGDTVQVASKHYIHCDPREESRRDLAAKYG